MIRKFLVILAKITLIFVFTILGVLLILPSFAQADDTYATLNVMAKDANGLKVTGVSFNIYEQKYDINGNKIFGDRINSGYIGNTGLQPLEIKNIANATKTVAFEYYKNDRNYEKFIVWDIKINGLGTQDVNLVLSSVRIILRDADNNLLKDLPFEIWSTVTDVAGNIVPKDALYWNERTEVIGAKTYYLIPENYILKIRYPDINNIDTLNYQFQVTKNQQTELSYTLSTLKVSSRNYQGNLQKNSTFKLYYEDNNNDFVQIGEFNTGDDGQKILYLPRGDYKIEFKDYNGNFNTTYGFSLGYGDEKTFSYNYGSLRLQILDIDNDAVTNVRVLLYRYANNQFQSQVFSGMTDNSGFVEVPLSSDYYIAQIQGYYYGLTYTTSSFYINENNSNNLQYILSKARIYLVSSANVNIKNTAFNLYYYNLDANGNPTASTQIGTFSTSTTGYAEISLPPGRYIVKQINLNNIYPINIEAEKLNNIYVTLRDSDSTANTTNTTQNNNSNTNTSQNTNSNNSGGSSPIYQQSTSLIPENLYALDSDSDGLADFQEKYIYDTNPFDLDTDHDGYADGLEVASGYNPNGTGRISFYKFSYGKPRVNSLSIEKYYASSLSTELKKRIGRDLGVSSKDWRTIVNAYIYGGYTISEIADTLNYGPGLVHPKIPATIWRNSIQYNKAHR